MHFLLVLVAVLPLMALSNVVELDEQNWRQILQNEWMVEFHAPWCPACKDLAKAWASFGRMSKNLKVRVGEIDVTKAPGLSGRFLVTALPTIFHVKDGVFRIYAGPRDKEDFISFIEKKKWTIVDPLPSWKHPDSLQMGVVASFFQLSMTVRDLHIALLEKYGLAPWMSYTIFGVATLTLGCLLGFMIVLLIDRIFPTKLPPTMKAKSKKHQQSKKASKNAKLSDKSSSDSNGNAEEAEKSNDDNVRRRVAKATRVD